MLYTIFLFGLIVFVSPNAYHFQFGKNNIRTILLRFALGAKTGVTHLKYQQ